MNRQKPLAAVPTLIASIPPSKGVAQLTSDGAVFIATTLSSPTITTTLRPTLPTLTSTAAPRINMPVTTPTILLPTGTRTGAVAPAPSATPTDAAIPAPTLTSTAPGVTPTATPTVAPELVATHLNLGPPNPAGVRLITGEVVNQSGRALAVAGLAITLTNGLGQPLATPVTKHMYWPLSSLAPGDRMPFEAGVLVSGEPVQVTIAVTAAEAAEPAPRLDLEASALAQVTEGAFLCTQVQVRNPGPALTTFLRVTIVFYNAEHQVTVFRDEISGPPLTVSPDRPAEYRLCVPAAETAGTTYALRVWGR